MEELEVRVDAGYDCADWYLCFKPIGTGATGKPAREPAGATA